MEQNNEVRNPDVPVETILKWKQVECWKLRAQVKKLEATVKALRKNIDMLIRDKNLKRDIAKELMLRERAAENSRLNKKLHNAYESIKELIQTNLKLKQQLHEQDPEDD